jgi:hypothetical protein
VSSSGWRPTRVGAPWSLSKGRSALSPLPRDRIRERTRDPARGKNPSASAARIPSERSGRQFSIRLSQCPALQDNVLQGPVPQRAALQDPARLSSLRMSFVIRCDWPASCGIGHPWGWPYDSMRPLPRSVVIALASGGTGRPAAGSDPGRHVSEPRGAQCTCERALGTS